MASVLYGTGRLLAAPVEASVAFSDEVLLPLAPPDEELFVAEEL